MEKFDTEEFLRERMAALLSLDLSVINAYMVKYGSMPLPDTLTGWAGVHKARIIATDIPADAKAASREWLTDNGFKVPEGL
jgi:hypothetical protein